MNFLCSLGQHDAKLRVREAPAAKASTPRSAGTGAPPLERIRVANVGARVDFMRGLPPFAGGVRNANRSLSNRARWAGNGSVSLDLIREEARVEPGPGIGRDNDFIFEQLLGLSEQRYRALVDEQVIS